MWGLCHVVQLFLSGCQDLSQLDVQCDTIEPHFNSTLIELILLNGTCLDMSENMRKNYFVNIIMNICIYICMHRTIDCIYNAVLNIHNYNNCYILWHVFLFIMSRINFLVSIRTKNVFTSSELWELSMRIHVDKLFYLTTVYWLYTLWQVLGIVTDT